MFCVLVGIVPPDEELWRRETVRGEVTSVEGTTAVKWRSQSSLVDDGGVVTLLVSCVTEAQPESVVAAVEAASLQEHDSGGDDSSIHCELWASAPAPLPLRPTDGGYDAIHVKEGESWEDRVERVMREWGLVLQRKILDEAAVAELRLLVDVAITDVEGALALHRPSIEIGRDFFCFREMASRNLQRFDLRLPSAGEFVEKHILGNDSVSAVLRRCLGSPEEIDYDVSVVYSRSGACAQGWHADGDHQKGASDAGWAEDGWKDRLADPYATCLFIPLIDLNGEVGFTQFWPGSHRHRDLVGFGGVAEVTRATFDGICRAGDGVWYDYRLLHRGMPNLSKETTRPVLQVVFKKKWYVERANYGEEPIAKEV
jgi:ectoine hydroxylase-related dioxygenase (phytanoyl-CoA dioxygenase family)